ncbi:Multidrug resistance-associated protein 1 [Linnemannia schmuckeri]|uniref:Multidrug resistance-associated protein 1 n=1 Tax=Linnemannia schmuckeri TaxID=64567 RepID=A0A9P5V946_9FUNG|nr:Multidrug resistance-associated protein 1 [Linnemannia schmuckeri]
MATVAIVGFLTRIHYLARHTKPHGLGRTAWIYWPTQISMVVAAITIWTLAYQFFSMKNYSVICAWSCLLMGVAWVAAAILNKYEHTCEIRSSSAIFAFYVTSICGALTILQTALDPGSGTDYSVTPLVIFALTLTAGFVVEAWPRGNTRVQRSSSVGMYGKANLFSRLTFWFFTPIISIGLNRILTADDIKGQLPKSLAAYTGYKRLSRAWDEALQRHRRSSSASSKETSPSLFWTVLKNSWEMLIPVLLSRVAIVLFSYTLPILLKELLNYLEDHESKPVSYGITLALGMFTASLCASLLNTYNRYQMLTLGVASRSALISMIYRKSLRLSAGSRNEASSGKIANHMSVDADQWWNAIVYISMWIEIPLALFISMKMLYNLLGWSMLAGVFAMLSLLPLQAWQARVFQSIQSGKLKAMDERMRLTTEVLSSMKIVKLYGWSTAFLRRILEIRNQELAYLRRIGVVEAFMSIIFISSSLIISLITFAVYALWGGPNFTPGTLTPQTVFVSMTLFAMLKGPIASLSDATTSTIGVLVATRRIQQFLLKEEVDEADVVRSESLPRDPLGPVILIKDSSFSWASPSQNELRPDPDERTALLATNDNPPNNIPAPTLQSIQLTVQRGSLTAIVGRVGQGKSSLLSAMIGDMYKLKGQVELCGRVAYVPQQAWICNATLKDNILFGNEYDEAKYRHVLFACGLEPDIAMLPGGDMTEIGERGINLSGGQKQRVSLARAAYDDADIYLLDDPLSAVDAHVDHHLWQNLIGPSGLLRRKARVLVTHGTHHLREMDQIVVVKDGSIQERGDYSQLMGSKKNFYRLIKEYTVLERRSSHATIKRRQSKDTAVEGVSATGEENDSEEPSTEGEAGADQDTSDDETKESSEPLQKQKIEKPNAKAVLTGAEKMKEGEVGFDVVLYYAKEASYRITATIVFLFLLAQGCLVSTSLWLKHWIKVSKEIGDDESLSLFIFLGVYAFLTMVYVLLYMVITWLGLAVARIRASKRIHSHLLEKVLRLPMPFFDTTPVGRIINRFSSDIFAVDVRIPSKLIDICLFGISVASTLLLIVFTTPSFILILPFLLIGYWFVEKCFLNVSRTLARIYVISKSPVYQHFHESLGGVSTIRATKTQERFIEKNAAMVDRMSNNFLSNMGSRRWLDVQLRILSTIVLLCAALFAVLQRDSMDPSLVGLTLSFALTITEEVTSLVRNFCDLQNQLIGLERIIEYTDLKTEAPDTTHVLLPAKWPSKGRISFKNYSTRYREGLDLVIKNVSVDILPSEKIGIVGRTGAGKSSLTLALFRLVEAANSYWAKESDNSRFLVADAAPIGILGTDDSNDEEYGGLIEIDGVDISTVGLEELRRHLAIIPQDPTLFAGSVRDNLDPFQELEDADLWEALERAHLKDIISELPGGLTFEVSSNGDNFSVGQRSLICLARALLRKTKILVLDEATAAVDVETDELIQKTIRKEFADRTILTIAHRIKTVMDSDRILVLEMGRVEEFDRPSVLLQKEESLFYRLAKQAGEI